MVFIRERNEFDRLSGMLECARHVRALVDGHNDILATVHRQHRHGPLGDAPQGRDFIEFLVVRAVDSKEPSQVPPSRPVGMEGPS